MAFQRRHCPKRYASWMVVSLAFAFLAANAFADRTKAVREAVEYVAKKYSKEAAEEGAESLTRKLTTLATKHGDEAIEAFRKVGPRSLRLIEKAGDNGALVAKLMARAGAEGAWVVEKPARLALFVKFGDAAADAMALHKGVAEGLIEQWGRPAARALKSVDGQNARRLIMMKESGEFAKIGRSEELLGVIEKHGDRAADFIWRNKGSLAAGATLAAFLKDPKPFIESATSLGRDALRGPGSALASEAARGMNWNMVALASIVLIVLLIAMRFRPWGRRPAKHRTDSESVAQR